MKHFAYRCSPGGTDKGLGAEEGTLSQQTVRYCLELDIARCEEVHISLVEKAEAVASFAFLKDDVVRQVQLQRHGSKNTGDKIGGAVLDKECFVKEGGQLVEQQIGPKRSRQISEQLSAVDPELMPPQVLVIRGNSELRVFWQSLHAHVGLDCVHLGLVEGRCYVQLGHNVFQQRNDQRIDGRSNHQDQCGEKDLGNGIFVGGNVAIPHRR